MKYILVIFIVLLALKKSILHKTGHRYLCAKKANGSCRPVTSEKAMHELNKKFVNAERYWSLTASWECGNNWDINHLRFCKSTCDKIRNDDFSHLHCSENDYTCLANDKTGQCEVFSDKCQAAAEACNRYPNDAYICENFRCERSGLTKPGDSGKCYSKFKTHH